MAFAEKIFSAVNLTVIPFWLLLLLAPGWKWTQRISGIGGPLLLSAIYVILFFRDIATSAGSFGSLANLRILFMSPTVLLAGWIHYLAFDLFIGAWEVRDAQRLGLAHLKVVPCLLLTLVLGPLGLLSYFMLRWPAAKNIEA